MSYPAEISFKRDRSLPPAARRVYDYLTTVLDFIEVRSVKSQVHSEQCAVGKPHFIDALNTLVRRGYLIEHARDTRGVRHFTLAHSINCDRLLTG